MSAFAAASRGSRLATRRLLDFLEGGLVAAFEELLGRDGCKYMHGAGDDARPSRLVARAEAGPVVAVEVFVEQEIVASAGPPKTCAFPRGPAAGPGRPAGRCWPAGARSPRRPDRGSSAARSPWDIRW